MHLTEIIVLLAMIISASFLIILAWRIYGYYVSSYSYMRFIEDYLIYLNQTISQGSFAIVILPYPIHTNTTQYRSIIVVVKK